MLDDSEESSFQHKPGWKGSQDTLSPCLLCLSQAFKHYTDPPQVLTTKGDKGNTNLQSSQNTQLASAFSGVTPDVEGVHCKAGQHAI